MGRDNLDKQIVIAMKCLAFSFSCLFWLSGLALIIVGGIIKNNYGDYFKYADNKFMTTPVFIIVIGVIVFIIGFLGCFGAIKENSYAMSSFFMVIVIIFILEIIVGILAFVYTSKVENFADDALKRAVEDVSDEDDPLAKELLDWMQNKFRCCGVLGPFDFNNVTDSNFTCGFDKGLKSCHRKHDCKKTLYSVGCKLKFSDFIKQNLIVVGSISFGISTIKFFGIVCVCGLMKVISLRNEYV
ncbi:23 kDa integral membrane protein isoform X1 [Hydra vulgaris]|uniref:23 kDa integral membrane protein isoform X1 n=1 Tax=Hydra vulgaris TaxID=6087 RepID=UPI0001926C19|nr:23 kDa integral membrane protein [Hydra vulgaris]